jgi:hypothetical protein
MASRLYQSEWAARSFATRLLSSGRPDLQPVVEVYVHRRKVEPWGDGRHLLLDVEQEDTA